MTAKMMVTYIQRTSQFLTLAHTHWLSFSVTYRVDTQDQHLHRVDKSISDSFTHTMVIIHCHIQDEYQDRHLHKVNKSISDFFSLTGHHSVTHTGWMPRLWGGYD